MKRVIASIAIAMCVVASWAVKADPTPTVVTQPDGTQLTIIVHGDEDCNWYTTSDGVLLYPIGNSYFVASISANGEIAPTTLLAHERSMRSDNETSIIAKQDKAAFYSAIKGRQQQYRARRISIGTAATSYFPHTGSPKALVILVEFSDTLFSVSEPSVVFDEYLNHEGSSMPDHSNYERRNHGSVRQYFNDMSNGAFTPQFDVYGPVRMEKPSAYYGEGTDNMTRIKEMIVAACDSIDKDVDFTEYDQDGDGFVDLVYVIYAGYSQSVGGNSVDCIWPKSGTLGSVSNTFDGMKINRFGINNELNYYPGRKFNSYPEITKRINGIGLFCHEFSHTLGFPDLYCELEVDNQELEYWDLMDGGEYVDNGYTPAPYSPWEKEVAGWTTIDEITEAKQITLADGQAVRIKSDTSDEYIILLNMQNNGWAKAMLGHGMLVYRIDYPYDSVNLFDKPNAITSGKPAVTLLPADGLLISSYRVYDSEPSDTKPYSITEYINSHYGDPYPGTSNVTEIEKFQMNECVIEKPIYNITENLEEGTISFEYLNKIINGIDNISDLHSQDAKQTVYSIDGRNLGTDFSKLAKGIYIVGGKKILK
ncbi:MAG: M6 family metalloprotease domain-containing protein [Prevotella sp.]|nr:M6 family metalloprotease domain-containing protein [Prevotella sp.]